MQALSPLVSDPDFTLYVGDVRAILSTLADASVDCCVTSPPYWGLRDYGTEGQLGLERTPDEFVAAMVAVFAEVRRVLKPHGTLWLNLGDSYNAYNGGAGPGSKLSKTQTEQRPQLESGFGLRSKDLKPKDLVGIPWRVALALQADGWYLRSDIIWAKPNPMPESITDRPTKAHEYVFLLTKGERYFFDQDAVREPFAPASEDRYRYAFGGKKAEDLHRQDAEGPGGNRTAPIGKRAFPTWGERKAAGATRGNVAFDGNVGAGTQRGVHGEGLSHDLGDPAAGRNIRTVWDIPTRPYPEAHFAVFPEELPRRCIAAGTSERGCCPECGAPWMREIDRGPQAPEPDHRHPEKRLEPHQAGNVGEGNMGFRASRLSGQEMARWRAEHPDMTIGWRPSCKCGDWLPSGEPYRVPQPVPAVVLDPFMGSGTTAFVARRLGRRSIGVEINLEYAQLAARRLSQQSLLAEEATA